MALVLQSRVSSCPGDPLTLLHPRLLPSPKEAAHTTADRAVDTAGVQVRLRDSELFRSRLSLSYARAVMLWQMEVTISVWCSVTIVTIRHMSGRARQGEAPTTMPDVLNCVTRIHMVGVLGPLTTDRPLWHEHPPPTHTPKHLKIFLNKCILISNE